MDHQNFGTHDGHQVLFYINNENGQEEKSLVKEVREWYNRTQLQQASSHLTQTKKGINQCHRAKQVSKQFSSTMSNFQTKMQRNLPVLRKLVTWSNHNDSKLN
jgi:hypothetical protein